MAMAVAVVVAVAVAVAVVLAVAVAVVVLVVVLVVILVVAVVVTATSRVTLIVFYLCYARICYVHFGHVELDSLGFFAVLGRPGWLIQHLKL